MEASGTETTTESSETGTDESETEQPTPQPETLRQQQRYAAVGGSLLAGGAVTVSIIQRFPDYTFVALVLGVFSCLFVYRLTKNSVFADEPAE